MLANSGGLVINSNGDRNYPGSGGMVGGLSAPGKGNAYIGGAGPQYQIFTPSVDSPTLPFPGGAFDPYPVAPFGGGPRPRVIVPSGGEQPPILEPGTGTGGGGTLDPPGPVLTPGGGGGGGGGGTCLACAFDPYSTGGGASAASATPNATVIEIVRNLLGRTREQVTGSGPVYLFSPQPGESNGGFPMKQLLILGALAFGGFWLYKKYAA